MNITSNSLLLPRDERRIERLALNDRAVNPPGGSLKQSFIVELQERHGDGLHCAVEAL